MGASIWCRKQVAEDPFLKNEGPRHSVGNTIKFTRSAPIDTRSIHKIYVTDIIQLASGSCNSSRIFICTGRGSRSGSNSCGNDDRNDMNGICCNRCGGKSRIKYYCVFSSSSSSSFFFSSTPSSSCCSSASSLIVSVHIRGHNGKHYHRAWARRSTKRACGART